MTKPVVPCALILAVIGLVVARTPGAKGEIMLSAPASQFGVATGASPPFDTAIGTPTNVGLVSFAAKKVKGKPRNVRITWKTASEPDTLGFNVYREVRAKRTRVNKGLIPSRGPTIGAVYTQKDVLPKGVTKACYRLQVVTSSGAKVLLPNKPCIKK